MTSSVLLSELLPTWNESRFMDIGRVVIVLGEIMVAEVDQSGSDDRQYKVHIPGPVVLRQDIDHSSVLEAVDFVRHLVPQPVRPMLRCIYPTKSILDRQATNKSKLWQFTVRRGWETIYGVTLATTVAGATENLIQSGRVMEDQINQLDVDEVQFDKNGVSVIFEDSPDIDD